MEIKDLVIVSIYDCGYCCSVCEDGIIERRFEGGGPLLDEVMQAWDIPNTIDFYNRLKERFPNKLIIVCEDGNIEIVN